MVLMSLDAVSRSSNSDDTDIKVIRYDRQRKRVRSLAEAWLKSSFVLFGAVCEMIAELGTFQPWAVMKAS